MDQLLTDLIPYNGDREVLLHWENFSTPVSNALQRMLYRYQDNDSWREGICFNHLEGMRLLDLLDTPHVGELRKTQIVDELSSVFGSYDANGDSFIVAPKFDLEDFDFPDHIDTATNFEELIAGIIEVFNEYRPIDERTMAVLRGRLPAFSRELRTLDEIGLEYFVTRERIRQIESKYIDLQINPFKSENSLLKRFIEILELSDNESQFIAALGVVDFLGN